MLERNSKIERTMEKVRGRGNRKVAVVLAVFLV